MLVVTQIACLLFAFLSLGHAMIKTIDSYERMIFIIAAIVFIFAVLFSAGVS